MEREISKAGLRGKRIAMSDLSYNDIPIPISSSSPFSNYAAGDGGFATFGPSEVEMMMMTSHSHHTNFLDELRHHQDLLDRQHAVLSYMEVTAKEAQALREENISLKIVNADLSNRLAVLPKVTSDYASASVGYSGPVPDSDLSSMLNEFERMGFIGGVSEERRQHDFGANGENPVPDGLLDLDPVAESMEPNRVSLPKSISVRSNGYLKTAQTGESSRVKANKQRVFVPGGEKEKQSLELDVYNQGMTKTELCNKWQNTGACPYGENCQFAHGIKELRPIIRHPRYKTEVCRMVFSGVHCPYGHRCHFRHTLTDAEKLKMSMDIRPLKPHNS